MSTDKNKQRTRSFVVPPTKSSNKKIEFSPEKSEGKHDRDTNLYRTRFKKKDLQFSVDNTLAFLVFFVGIFFDKNFDVKI